MPLLNPMVTHTFDLQNLHPANPGAGLALAYPCPANARLEILSCNFLLTTDANAANRYITLSCTDGATIWGVSRSQVAHTATLGWNYFFSTGLEDEIDLSADSLLLEPMAYGIFLDPGETFSLIIDNVQIADSLTGIYLRTKLWIRE